MPRWIKWTTAGFFALLMTSHIASVFKEDDFTSRMNQQSQESLEGLRKIDQAYCNAGVQTSCDSLKAK